MSQSFEEFLREGREEGYAIGFQEERIKNMAENVKSLMNKLQITKEESMDILNIPPHEQEIILSLLLSV